MRHIKKEINQRYVFNHFERLNLFVIGMALMEVKVLIMLRLIFSKPDHIA